MKCFIFSSATLLFLLAFGSIQAQEPSKKELKTDIRTAKKDIKSDRKALHKLEGNAIPQRTKETLQKDFGNANNAKWKRTSYFDEATFTKNGKEMKAYYDYDNKLVGTTQAKKFKDLPAKAQKEIKTKYKDYNIGQVIFFDHNKANDSDMFLFETQFNNGNNYFVELTKNNAKQILQISAAGEVSFFKKIK